MGIYNANTELIGVFNVYLAEKFGIKYCIVPPFSPSNALTFINPAENSSNKITFEKEIHETISEFFSKLKSALIISAFPPSVTDTQVYFWKKYKVIPNYTYQLSLDKSEHELFENLTSEKRKSIRRAEKDNLEIVKAENFNDVKSLILKTFNRKNKKVNSVFLEKILFQFANTENSFAFVAYQNGKA